MVYSICFIHTHTFIHMHTVAVVDEAGGGHPEGLREARTARVRQTHSQKKECAPWYAASHKWRERQRVMGAARVCDQTRALKMVGMPIHSRGWHIPKPCMSTTQPHTFRRNMNPGCISGMEIYAFCHHTYYSEAARMYAQQ